MVMDFNQPPRIVPEVYKAFEEFTASYTVPDGTRYAEWVSFLISNATIDAWVKMDSHQTPNARIFADLVAYGIKIGLMSTDKGWPVFANIGGLQ